MNVNFIARCCSCFVSVLLCAATLSAVRAEESVTLQWDASPDADVQAYHLYYSQAGSSSWSRVAMGNKTSGAVTGLQAGESYLIYIVAVNTANVESTPS